MMHLYHYCASWAIDGQVFQCAGVMKSPGAICFSNYNEFASRVASECGQENIAITSLSFLGIEDD